MERSAIYMMVCQDVSITQISYQYGYSNPSSFSKAFKKHYKISPQEYRKARKDKQ
jgi:AraC-like DNA-binding protein